MSKPLSVSVTFQALEDRVAAIEAGGGIGGGPYLPLIGGTLTGGLVAPSQHITANSALDGDVTIGGAVSVGDANFHMSKFATYVENLYDTGDALVYDRSGNNFLFYIGNAIVGTLNASTLTLPTGLSVPSIQFDTGDALVYDRPGNVYNFTIGGAIQFAINSGAVSVANVFTVGDGNFGMNLNGGSPYIAFDVNDYIQYTRSSNTYSFNIGSATKASIDGSGVVTATQFQMDANYYCYVSSGTPVIHFDANDQITYDRTANTYAFSIGGAAKATLSASAFVVTPAATLGATTVDSASGLLVVNGGSGHGQVALSPGATTGTGSVVLLDPTGSQHSAIGPCTTAGPMGFISNNGAGFYFSGGVMQIISGLHLYLGSIPTYANNAAAITGGLAAGDVYMTSTGQLMVRF